MIRQVLEAACVYTNETYRPAPLLVKHSLPLFGKAGDHCCHQVIIIIFVIIVTIIVMMVMILP